MQIVVQTAMPNASSANSGVKRPMPNFPQFPDSAIELAGFVLAHSAWSVSDLPEGELLCPLAGVERGGKREFMRFEADTQSEAIENAWSTINELPRGYTALAFAHEGLVTESGRKIDALILHVLADHLDTPIVFIQKFKPFASGAFQLLGPPRVSIGDIPVQGRDADHYAAILQRGVQSHSEVAQMWDGWLCEDN